MTAMAMEGTWTVVVIDDDHEFRTAIGTYLAAHGMRVVLASGTGELDAMPVDWAHCVIVLDLHLGNVDGIDVMRALRGMTDAPIILITGHRTSETDRVIGLELGADDYLGKPFGPRELLARIRVVGRRHDELCQIRDQNVSLTAVDNKRNEPRCYVFGGWQLDRKLRILKDPSGADVRLTKGDFALLVAFLEGAGQPLSRESLLNATRIHDNLLDRSVDVQILRLRRRFDKGGGAEGLSGHEIIKTERGAGYVFTLTVTTE